jgi:hypothetical protein
LDPPDFLGLGPPPVAVKLAPNGVCRAGAFVLFVGSHERERDVAEEVHSGPIQRDRASVGSGRGVREIARALKCSRRTVREIRDGQRDSPEKPRAVADPLWMAQVDWTALIRDLGLGHPLKFLWGEKAQSLTTYSNFWKWYGRHFFESIDVTWTSENRLLAASIQ